VWQGALAIFPGNGDTKSQQEFAASPNRIGRDSGCNSPIKPEFCLRYANFSVARVFAISEHTYMDVEYKRDALKALRRMQPAKAQDIMEAVDRIAADPAVPNNNVKPLKGVPNGYRVRVGDHRASYTLDRKTDKMEVFEIAPRGGAYR
jgi:mRNA interferase RelE/StbE